MSDYSKEHTKRKPVKSYDGQVASAPMSGTKDTPSHKSHDKTISLGHGLAMGSVHSAHTKESVKGAPKASTNARKKAYSFNKRSEQGGANPTAIAGK